MRDIEIQDFGKNILQTLFGFFQSAGEKDIFEKVGSSYKTKQSYSGYWYEMKIDNSNSEVVFYKTSNENTIEFFRSPIFTPEYREKLSTNDLKKFLNVLSNKVKIENISMLKQMTQDFNINVFDEAYSILDKELQKYYPNMVADMNLVFDASEKFKKTVSLNDGDNHYHKYTINDKQVLVFSNTSCINEYFTIYERDQKTNTIRIITGEVTDVLKKHKIRTIVVGKYQKIIEEYLENHKPICVIENDEIKYVDYIHEILDLNYHSKELGHKYNLQKKLPYNPENMKEMFNYLQFNNMYTLLTHGMWSIKGRWQKNENNEHYFVFESEIDYFKSHEKMVYEEENALQYISSTNKKAVMLSLPEGALKNEWANLIVESYLYIKNNKEKLPLSAINDNELKEVENYLKENEYIS